MGVPPEMTDELREKISHAHKMRARLRRSMERVDPGSPKCLRKKCNGCGQWLPLYLNFTFKKYKLASGEEKWYPASKCKDCENARKREWVKKQSPEEWAARRRQHARNQQARSYDPIERHSKVPPGPIVQFLDEQVRAHGSSAVGTALQMDEARIRRLAAGKDEFGKPLQHVTLSLVDRVVTNLGRPDLLTDLYPVE